MNEETTLPIEEPSVPENEASLPAETEAAEVAEVADGTLTEATIYEELFGSEEVETIAGTVISQEDLQSIANYNAHVDLFGFFLVCGTLIGLALLRDRYGN